MRRLSPVWRNKRTITAGRSKISRCLNSPKNPVANQPHPTVNLLQHLRKPMKLSLIHNRLHRVFALASLLLTPGILIAHPGDGEIHSLSQGILHFFSGWDHILLSASAGLILVSGKKLWNRTSLCAAVCVPLLVTALHQSQFLMGNSQWIAAASLGLASFCVLILSSLIARFRPFCFDSMTSLRKVGLGFALLALALIQL